jgi:single-strand DNA-binding protein
MKNIMEREKNSSKNSANHGYRKDNSMNKVILIGRLTKEPEVRWGTVANGNSDKMAIARFSLAVDRKFKKDGEASADFINCVAFGKNGEFAEKYLKKGTKIAVEGRIQTGSYTNKDGQKVYTTDIVVEGYDFCESKGSEPKAQEEPKPQPSADGWLNIPDGIGEELPFN